MEKTKKKNQKKESKFESEVKQWGNSGGIAVPKKYIGKKAKVEIDDV